MIRTIKLYFLKDGLIVSGVFPGMLSLETSPEIFKKTNFRGKDAKSLKEKRVRVGNFEKKTLGYIMTLPATAMALIVSIYPLLNGILLSFQNKNLIMKNQGDFVGLENYLKIMKDEDFFNAIKFSFIYTIAVVICAYLVGFVLAMMLKEKMFGRGLFRTLLLLPWVVAPSVAATNWSWILNDQIGIINTTLQSLGLIDKPILFLADATITRFTVIFTGTWKNFPFMMIVILAGLQSIPKELYESAYVDGAGYWKSMRYITIPTIARVSSVCIVLMIIWTFNNMENIYTLTTGGPAGSTYILPILTYYTAFFRNKLSYAATIAVVMLIILLALTLIYFYVQNKEKRLQRKQEKAIRKEMAKQK